MALLLLMMCSAIELPASSNSNTSVSSACNTINFFVNYFRLKFICVIQYCNNGLCTPLFHYTFDGTGGTADGLQSVHICRRRCGQRRRSDDPVFRLFFFFNQCPPVRSLRISFGSRAEWGKQSKMFDKKKKILYENRISRTRLTRALEHWGLWCNVYRVAHNLKPTDLQPRTASRYRRAAPYYLESRLLRRPTVAALNKFYCVYYGCRCPPGIYLRGARLYFIYCTIARNIFIP